MNQKVRRWFILHPSSLLSMPDPAASPPATAARGRARWWEQLPFDRVGLVAGPLLLAGWVGLTDHGPLTPEAHRLAGILPQAGVWCPPGPPPTPATALLAVALAVAGGAVPADDGGRAGLRAVLAPFADPSVFFLLGG